SGSASPNSTITRKSSSSFSALRSGSALLRRELASSMSFWACSRLFQNFSAAIKALSSAMRFWALGTSKKPPQMSELIRGRNQFGSSRIKHCAKCKLQERGLQVEQDIRGHWMHLGTCARNPALVRQQAIQRRFLPDKSGVPFA